MKALRTIFSQYRPFFRAIKSQPSWENVGFESPRKCENIGFLKFGSLLLCSLVVGALVVAGLALDFLCWVVCIFFGSGLVKV
jgi:hypothetical protein